MAGYRYNGKYTYLERLEIEEMLKKGDTVVRIANHLGRNVYTLMGEIKRGGGEKEYDAAIAQKNATPKKMPTEKKKLKPLTFEEREIIEKELKNGVPAGSIATLIGRSKNCVITEIRNNGGRDLYNAYAAEQRKHTMFTQRLQSLKKMNDEHNASNRFRKYDKLVEKIEILEMQIEIIIEQINKLRGL